MMIFDRVTYRYGQKSETSFAVKEVSFSFQKGCINGIVGANGSGKSTILKLMAGILKPQSGEVSFAEDSAPDSDGIPSRRVGIIFQNPDNQIVGTTVEEDLAFGLENLGVEQEQMHQRVSDIARRFYLGDLLKRPVSHLSGGQKQLLCIASVMIMNPEWIIFDEPTSHLDPWARRDFWRIIKEIIASSDSLHGIIIVSQLTDEIRRFSSLIVLEHGQVIFSGTQDDLKAISSFPQNVLLPAEWILEKLKAGQNV